MSGTYTIKLYKTENNSPFLVINPKLDTHSKGILILNLIDDEFIGSYLVCSAFRIKTLEYLIENKVVSIFETFLPLGQIGAKYITHLVMLTPSKKLELI
jgi:hypothetical protein